MFESLSLSFRSKSGKTGGPPTVQFAVPELESRIAPAKYTWVGGAAGSDNKWSVPADWKVGDDPATAQQATVKPGWADDVVFDGTAGGNTWSTVDENFTVQSLTITSTVGTSAAETLTLANDLTLTGNAPSEIAGGTIAGPGTLALEDSDGAQLTWRAGVIKSKVTIAPVATLVLTGEGGKELQGGRIVNDGMASWDGQGELILKNKIGENEGGKIENNGVFWFTDCGGKEITGAYVNSYIENYGTINISHTAGTELRFFPAFKNYGFVNLTSGHAKTGFTEFGGPISIAAGCEFRMGYPPLPSAAGNDDVRIAQGVHGSDVIVGEGKAVFGPGCVVHVGAGNPATEMVTFQNVDDYSSKLYGDGNFTIRGTYNWYGDGTPAAGFWDQGGTAQVGTPTNTTATLNFKADRHDIQRVLTNYGVMNWVRLTIPLLSDTPPSSAEIVLFGPGTIYNKGGANFNITSNGPRTQKLKANVERTFVNYGTLTTTNDRPDPGRGIVGGSIEIDFYDQDEEVRGGTTFKGKHEHKGKAVINKKELLAAGVQNINPDALLVVLGDVEQTGGDLVASSADVQVAGTYRQSAGALVGGASLVAMATTYEFQGGTADFSGTRNGESPVADSIHQTGGTLVMHYTSALDVTGAFDQEAGTVQIDMSGATVGGGWGIGQAGSLYASRAGIAGNLSNNGLVELGLITPPPSQTYADTLSITGDYSQSGTGRLTMDIVTYPNWMVDSLSISGHAAFGGTFTLRAPAGFNPGPMTIGLISYQTHSGEFATYVLPPGNWIEVYTENPPNGPGGFQIHQPYGPPYYP